MKAFVCALSVFFILSSHAAMAQPGISSEARTAKSRLFDDLPSRLNFRLLDVKTVFSLPIGAEFNGFIADGFHFRGTVVSRSKDGQPYQTIVLQSINRKGAAFTLTKRNTESGTLKYSGRIVSFKNADAFDVVEQDGSYTLVKRNVEDIVTE